VTQRRRTRPPDGLAPYLSRSTSPLSEVSAGRYRHAMSKLSEASPWRGLWMHQPLWFTLIVQAKVQ